MVGFSYDVSGNRTQVVPPGRAAHLFSYTPVGLTGGYTPPAVQGTGPTTYTYDRHEQMTRVDRPDGTAIGLSYDTGGRLSTVTFDAGQITFGYLPSGWLGSISAPAENAAYT